MRLTVEDLLLAAAAETEVRAQLRTRWSGAALQCRWGLCRKFRYELYLPPLRIRAVQLKRYDKRVELNRGGECNWRFFGTQDKDADANWHDSERHSGRYTRIRGRMCVLLLFTVFLPSLIY